MTHKATVAVRRRDCALYFADVGCGIITVDAVEEDDARVAVFPGQINDHVEDPPGVQALDCLTGPWVDDIVFAAALHRFHELLLSLIHISEPTRLRRISYAVFCLKKK